MKEEQGINNFFASNRQEENVPNTREEKWRLLLDKKRDSEISNIRLPFFGLVENFVYSIFTPSIIGRVGLESFNPSK